MEDVRRYDDFAAIRAEDENEWRRVLREGDPIERAWAAWALALAIGADGDPALIDALHESPTPGLRSLLLVVLAGHGERSVIEAFAMDDPDEDVRASACRYLATITAADDQRTTEMLIGRLVGDPSATVRREILGLAIDGRLSIPNPIVEHQVLDDDLKVRSLAVDVLLDPKRGDPRFPTVLSPLAIHEVDGELRRRIARAWIKRAGARPLVRDLVRDPALDRILVERVLRDVSHRRERFAWAELLPLSDRSSGVDRHIARLLRLPTEQAGRTWLLRLAAGQIRYEEGGIQVAGRPSTAAADAAATAWRRMPEILTGLRPGDLDANEIRILAQLAEDLEMWLADERASLETEGYDPDDLGADDDDGFQANSRILRVMLQILGTKP